MLHLIAALVVSASLMPPGKQAYVDANGAPLAGGRLYTYAAGTSTPLATYSDEAGVTPNTNPVILDARGEASVFWGSAPYKIVLRDAADVTVWTQDNVYALGRVTVTGGSVPRTLEDHLRTLPDAVVTATGATTPRSLPDHLRTLPDVSWDAVNTSSASVTTTGTTTARRNQDRWADTINVRDFGAKGDGVTDDADAIDAAVAAAAARLGAHVFFPASATPYIVRRSIALPAGVGILGAGARYAGGSRIRQTVAGQHVFTIGAGVYDVRFQDISIEGSTTGVPLAGSYGVSMSGNYPTGSYRISFANVTFRGFARGISAVALDATHTWQIDGVNLQRVTFVENTDGIYLDSYNADYWHVESCTFGPVAGGNGINLVRGGWVHVTTSVGGFAGSNAFVQAGDVENLLIDSSQCESMAYFLDLVGPTGNYLNPTTIISSTVDSPVRMQANRQLVLIGNRMNEDVQVTATDGVVYNLGSEFLAGKSITLAGNSYVAQDSRRSGLALGRSLVTPKWSLGYSASMTPDASLGNTQVVSPSDGTAFAINAPTNPRDGQQLTFIVRNVSGGALGTATWDAVFKMDTWVSPANGFSRSITFVYTGSNWVEVCRGSADVPN